MASGRFARRQSTGRDPGAGGWEDQRSSGGNDSKPKKARHVQPATMAGPAMIVDSLDSSAALALHQKLGEM